MKKIVKNKGVSKLLKQQTQSLSCWEERYSTNPLRANIWPKVELSQLY